MLTRSCALLVLVAMAAAQCGKGEANADGCCVCYTGWKVGATDSCDECAEGYVFDATNNVCSNGRSGSTCATGLEYPYFGCSVGGVKIGDCSPGNVFPCVCSSGNCESAKARLSPSGCYPKGPRMYTSFPNQPVVGSPYSLTFVGCELSSADKYAVIPAYTEDLSVERPCSTLTGTDGGISANCQFNNGQNAELGGNSTDACKGRDGFLLTGLRQATGGSEYTYEPINMKDETVFGDVVGRDEKETGFKVCWLTTNVAKDGSTENVWTEVSSHNYVVNSRQAMYKISKTASFGPNSRAAAGDGGDDDDCCDGLKLGSLCLPLWVFLLLWLLMACCLGAMGYTLHKNKNEIEAQKNNEKYENFRVDAEMSAMAARRDDDDDDI